MDIKRFFLSPLVLGPIFTFLMGNISLGLITAGITILIWGQREGSNFIVLTTIGLVILTSNINMEIIFLYSISLAFIIDENCREKQFVFLLACLTSLATFPVWIYILGKLPVHLLNQFNIAGGFILVSALILTYVKGLILIKNASLEEIADYFFLSFVAVFEVMGVYWAIPCWVLGNYFLNKYTISFQNMLKSRMNSYILSLFFMFFIIFTAYIVLPVNGIWLVVLIFLSSVLFYCKSLPVFELVYISVILGIIFARLGLLI